MGKARIIGKITLNQAQLKKLAELGVTDIASDNPKTRDDKEEIIRRIGNAEAIIINISTNITDDVIYRSPNLRFIQTWSTGTDNIDVKAAETRGITIKNVPDFAIESVAEKTIGIMIFIANNLLDAHQDAKAGNWNYTKFQGVELKGKVLCIVGKGNIGKRVGELASAFGMKIFFADSKTSKNDLQHLLAQSDFITLHCPYRESTHHLLSTDEFNSMKKGVYLINNSRGGIVDESALLNALDAEIVKFASIDVFENEPPKKDDAILSHQNVFVTPHCAWNTKEAVQRLSDTCIQNLSEYLLA